MKAPESRKIEQLLLRRFKFKRYPDGCYAVVGRGPCGNSRRTALRRYLRSGLIGSVSSGR